MDDRLHACLPPGEGLLNLANLSRVERSLFEKLRALDRQAFAAAVKKGLTKDEIEAPFVRRDKIVQLFEQRIASLGEARVLIQFADARGRTGASCGRGR